MKTQALLSRLASASTLSSIFRRSYKYTFPLLANTAIYSKAGREQEESLQQTSQQRQRQMSAMPQPPVARRDEGNVVYIGAAPPGWDPDLPRQGEESTEALLDPPAAFPDPYGWLRDDSRKDSAVLDHLSFENEYTQAITAHLSSFREELYKEFLSRIQETDHSAPRPVGQSSWVQYSRTFEGKSYEVYCRAHYTKDHPVRVEWDQKADSPILPGEEVLLDVNDLAEKKDYCVVGDVETSPSHQLLGFSTDFVGEERYSLVVKNLETGEWVEDGSFVKDMDCSVVWGNDDSTLFYVKLDDNTRPYQVYRRKVGSGKGQVEDELLFHEEDEMFYVNLHKTLDNRYIVIESASTETSEVHVIDLQQENDGEAPTTVQCLCKRRYKVLYHVDHRHGTWWIQSNVGNLTNYALFSAPVSQSNDPNKWELVRDENTGVPLFDGSDKRALDHVTCLNSHVILSGREDGLPRVWVLSVNGNDRDKNDQDTVASSQRVVVSKWDRLEFDEEAYDVSLTGNYNFYSNSIMVSYDSLTTPTQWIDIPLDDVVDTTKRIMVKERFVRGYEKELYASKRTKVVARDGTSLPVDLLYRKDVMTEFEASGKPVPVLMYGYGAYGICEEAEFSSSLLPLLDRGVVYVLTHVRGGGEMGRQWYEEPNGGKYLCKKNTFNDFVDIARWLIQDIQLTTSEQLACEGRSAGGLLIGASINQAPDLFRVAILGVPAVDMMVGMCDASINLVVTEWEEWGNPNEVKFFEYMKEYSPMDNVQKDAVYPACLLSGGLHDPRVQYWEPAKFTAQLRHNAAKREDGSHHRPICLKMEMSAGHFSASDRYKYWRELAFDYAFLLDQLGLTHVETRPSNPKSGGLVVKGEQH